MSGCVRDGYQVLQSLKNCWMSSRLCSRVRREAAWEAGLSGVPGEARSPSAIRLLSVASGSCAGGVLLSSSICFSKFFPKNTDSSCFTTPAPAPAPAPAVCNAAAELGAWLADTAAVPAAACERASGVCGVPGPSKARGDCSGVFEALVGSMSSPTAVFLRAALMDEPIRAELTTSPFDLGDCATCSELTSEHNGSFTNFSSKLTERSTLQVDSSFCFCSIGTCGIGKGLQS